MLEELSLAERVVARYGVAELKPMLKQRGLPVSGRKADLAARLVEADPLGMQKTVAGFVALRCSQAGRTIVEAYVAREKAQRAQMEARVLEALQQNRFAEASQIRAAFNAAQVFPPGLNIDWETYDPAFDVALLTRVFSKKPKLLSDLDTSTWRKLRLAAAMEWLVGGCDARYCLEGYETGLPISNEVAARMIWFHARHLQDLAEYRRMGVRRATILGANKDDPLTCGPCRGISGKTYNLGEMPELPYERCTSEMGCRCMASAVLR